MPLPNFGVLGDGKAFPRISAKAKTGSAHYCAGKRAGGVVFN